MILLCSFEELTALAAGARLALAETSAGGGVRVAAPPAIVADVEQLLAGLDGDIGVDTIADQQRMERAVAYVAERLHERMHSALVDGYVGAEDAVVAYFDYAHVFTVYHRVQEMGAEMRAMAELMTGRPPDEKTARNLRFPD
jgi:hypothetical protein